MSFVVFGLINNPVGKMVENSQHGSTFLYRFNLTITDMYLHSHSFVVHFWRVCLLVGTTMLGTKLEKVTDLVVVRYAFGYLNTTKNYSVEFF